MHKCVCVFEVEPTPPGSRTDLDAQKNYIEIYAAFKQNDLNKNFNVIFHLLQIDFMLPPPAAGCRWLLPLLLTAASVLLTLLYTR